MRKQTIGGSLKDRILSCGFYILFILVAVVYTCMAPAFLTAENIVSILNAATFSLFAAAGTSLVFISGNMDMSIGSIALVAAAALTLGSKAGLPVSAVILLTILVGALIGLVNGILVAYGRMNSMLTTLGLMLAYRGIGLQITGGRQITLASEYKNFARIKIMGLPVWVVLSLLAVVIVQIVLKKTRFGAYCYALGCSESAAKKVGIPVRKVKIAVFVISGICAAVTGLIVASRLGVMRSTIGSGMEFDIVAAIVIGGVSLQGGRGSVLPGTFLGVLLLKVIDNGLAMVGASPYAYRFAEGMIIFAAMYMDSLRSLRKKSA